MYVSFGPYVWCRQLCFFFPLYSVGTSGCGATDKESIEKNGTPRTTKEIGEILKKTAHLVVKYWSNTKEILITLLSKYDSAEITK